MGVGPWEPLHFPIHQTQLILLVYIPASQSYTVQCTEWNGASPVFVMSSVFDIWEGLEWVSDHVIHVHLCSLLYLGIYGRVCEILYNTVYDALSGMVQVLSL